MTSISSLDTEEGVDNFYSKKIVTGQVPNGTKYVFLLLLSIPSSDGRTERVRPWSDHMYGEGEESRLGAACLALDGLALFPFADSEHKK